MNNKVSLCWPAIPLIIASYLSLTGLTVDSYWWDELWSAAISHPDNDLSQVIDLTLGDYHPAFFQICLWVFFKLFGFSELSGRILSALAFITAIPGIYLLCKNLYGKESAFFASSIAASNYFLLIYSHEVRSYSTLFALTIYTIFYAQRIIEKNLNKDWLMFYAVSFLLISTHYFGLYVLIFAFLLLLLKFLGKFENKKLFAFKICLLVTAIIISYLPTILIITTKTIQTSFWIPPVSWHFFYDYFEDYFSNTNLIFLAKLLSLFGIAFGLLNKNLNWRKSSLMLFSWIVLCCILPWMHSKLMTPVITARNTIIILPAILMLIAGGISCIPKTSLRYFIFICFLGLSIYELHYQGFGIINKKQDWRGFVFFLAKQSDPIYSIKDPDHSFNIYFELLNIDKKVLHESTFLANNSKNKAKSIWIVDGHFANIENSKLKEKITLEETERSSDFLALLGVHYKVKYQD